MSKNEYEAFFRLCKKHFDISHSGQHNVKKYCNGSSHIKIENARAAKNLTDCFNKPETSHL